MPEQKKWRRKRIFYIITVSPEDFTDGQGYFAGKNICY